jgi:tetratricopeptide (TPR) repeat protein
VLGARGGGAGGKRLAAYVLRRAKDFRGALSLLDEAVKEESKTKNRVDPMLLIERLGCLLATENEPLVREALDMMQSAYGFDPDCVEAEGVDLLVREGLKDVAMKVSKGVREGNKLCQMRVAMRVYGANQDGSGVLSVVSRLLGDKKTVSDIKSQELDLLFGCAEYFSAAKDYKIAVRCADILVKRDQSYPNAMDLLGSLYIGAGFLTRKSLEAMIVLAKERKDDLVASYLAGLSLYYGGRHSESIPFLEPVVKKFPNESRPAMYLAMAYFFSGDRKKALDILEGLESFAKKNIDIYYCRSLVYREFDRQRSIEELEKFVTASAEEDRFSFSELKLRKAKSDLEALKRGETLAPVPPSDFYILWE